MDIVIQNSSKEGRRLVRRQTAREPAGRRDRRHFSDEWPERRLGAGLEEAPARGSVQWLGGRLGRTPGKSSPHFQMAWRDIQRQLASNSLEEAPRAHSASAGIKQPGGSAAGTFSVSWHQTAWRTHSASHSSEVGHDKLQLSPVVDAYAPPSTAQCLRGRRRGGDGSSALGPNAFECRAFDAGRGQGPAPCRSTCGASSTPGRLIQASSQAL